MAILSRFVNDDRFLEIEGCPLRAGGGGDEAACADCPYNAVLPGKARLGCVVQTPKAELDNALAWMERVDPAGHAVLRNILHSEKRASERTGLTEEQLEQAAALAEKLVGIVGNDPDQRQVVSVLVGFCRAAKKTGAPIRIFA